jgi:hypothetical protein
MNNNQPTKKRYLAVIGGGCLAIILGAIGSGVWELLLHPTARVGWLTITDIVTRYSVEYEEKIVWLAANDPFSETFLHLLGFLASGIIFFLTLLWLTIILTALRMKRSQAGNNVEDASTSRVSLKKRFQEYFSRLSLKKLFVFSVLYGTLVSGICFWWILQIAAVGAATKIARDFNVSMQAFEPYIKRNEMIRLRSRFATMRTSQDYKTLAQDVNTISEKYKIPLPAHTPRK